jgi:hypothetical protein
LQSSFAENFLATRYIQQIAKNPLFGVIPLHSPMGPLKNNYIDLRRRGGKIRLITGITKEDTNYRNELMKIVDELRHLDEIKGSIAVSISLPSKESHGLFMLHLFSIE